MGRIIAGPLSFPCALGREGMTYQKREGDGKTPCGTFRILQGFYRPDRMRHPPTKVAFRPIKILDGWCDDPQHRCYNQPVQKPFQASHETMWRKDNLYDIVLDLDWNRRPIRRGRGSAIFMHQAHKGFKPTEGCIALRPIDLKRLLPFLSPSTKIIVKS